MHVEEVIWKPFKRVINLNYTNLARLVSNFGVDINRTDAFDASPLMLVYLLSCGVDLRRVCVVMPKLFNIYLIRGLSSIATRFKGSGTASHYLSKR